MFNFHSSQTKTAIKKNRTLAEELKEGASFAFKVCLCPVGQSQLLMCGGQHRAPVQDECRGFLKALII